MKSAFDNTGFTLLELLVVMALFGLLAGVAVPRMWAGVEAVAADAEKRTLVEMASQVTLHAFLRHESRTLVFENRSVHSPDGIAWIVFDYIAFPRQQIHWNTRGFPDARTLDYTIRGRTEHLALF
jgi:prepilin-type N-terminal cleavage/methylation domain-containing protein